MSNISTAGQPATIRRRHASRRDPEPPNGDLAVVASSPDTDPCDVCCDAMPGYLCGDLPAPDIGWLIGHTKGCADCADVLQRYQRIDNILDRLHRFVIDDFPTPPPFPVKQRAAYGRIDSPLGPLYVAVTDKGVCEIGYSVNESEAAFVHHLESRGFRPVPDDWAVARVADQLHEYFGGKRNRFEVPFDFSGITPFTRSVLTATAEVPFGQLSTYRTIAERVGQPGATRAVGNALGRNPIPVIVPCHRVIRSDHTIGGYTGGIDIKQRLLSHEGVMLG